MKKINWNQDYIHKYISLLNQVNRLIELQAYSMPTTGRTKDIIELCEKCQEDLEEFIELLRENI